MLQPIMASEVQHAAAYHGKRGTTCCSLSWQVRYNMLQPIMASEVQHAAAYHGK